jgi:hypothetical protein
VENLLRGTEAFESLKRATKVDMTFIPYPGGAPALNACWGSM